MAASVGDIRVAIKAALSTISGLHAQATEPAAPSLPAAWPAPVSWSYDEDFSASTTYQFKVWIAVGLGADINRGQTALDPYLSPTGSKSVKAALLADVSLGGVVNSVRVIGGDSYRTEQIANTDALVAGLNVEVFA